MTRKKTRRSRRSKRKTASRFLTWAGLFLLAAGAVTMLHSWSPARFTSGWGLDHAKTAQPAASDRRPALTENTPVSSAHAETYSVIPGGIHSKKQLVKVLAGDPAVAKHYANFDLAKFHFVRLRRGREAYVSYRIGDMIFWTNHKIPLFAGETLVTDGTHYARSRCGNRVSAVPKQPTSAYQPSDMALAAPILHITPASPKLAPLTGFLAPGGIPVDGRGVGDGSPVFPVVFLPPAGGGGGGSSGGPLGGPPVYPPGGDTPVQVPEPGTLLLLSSGLAMLGLLYLWNLWRR